MINNYSSIIDSDIRVHVTYQVPPRENTPDVIKPMPVDEIIDDTSADVDETQISPAKYTESDVAQTEMETSQQTEVIPEVNIATYYKL